jgi:hypothetical protein
MVRDRDVPQGKIRLRRARLEVAATPNRQAQLRNPRDRQDRVQRHRPAL